MPTTYTIIIDEYQRKLILKCLQGITKETLASMVAQPGNGTYDTMQEEYKCLIAMVDDLPNVESENPDILHGFAL